jgi:hypothetical protein
VRNTVSDFNVAGLCNRDERIIMETYQVKSTNIRVQVDTLVLFDNLKMFT